MGLTYAPFDPEEPRPPWKPSSVVAPPVKRDDVTECNYLVLFFVLGVFLLTLIDSIR